MRTNILAYHGYVWPPVALHVHYKHMRYNVYHDMQINNNFARDSAKGIQVEIK